MKPLKEIEICKADAINYYRGDNKDFLHKIFLLDNRFKKVLEPNIYFLLGDKGTGKTAFAVYNSNNGTDSYKSILKFTTETDFKRFIRLISSGKINVSDFVSVWKVILLLIICKEIKSNIDENLINKYLLLRRINESISKYYQSAFSPEIANLIELFDKQEILIDLFKGNSAKAERSQKREKSAYQIDLLEIENKFKKALTDIHIKRSFILFIDGTDQIPFDIKREEYLECLRGLANAIWELNQLVFPDIINSRVQFVKIVLLMRPDIFSIIRFHNANSKIKDNSVILDWTTSESNWKNSTLFKTVDNLLSSQQDTRFALGYCWQAYFEDNFQVRFDTELIETSSFLALLRRTFMRPRDMFMFLDLLFKEAMSREINKITTDIFNSTIKSYSQYLLGEVKDQFNFFHEESVWQMLMSFFKYLDGNSSFDYKFFISIYKKFLKDHPQANKMDIFEKPEILLQNLYSNNIICYIEEKQDEELIFWSYNEKNYTNLQPMVSFDCKYSIHIGLQRSIGVGKPNVRHH